MSDLGTMLDLLLTEQGFKISGDSTMRCYTRSDLTLLFQPNSYGRIELVNDNLRYTGSHINFTLKGPVRKDVTEQMYWTDLHRWVDTMNERLKKFEIEISGFHFVTLNGRNELKVSDLLLEYKKGKDVSEIASTIVMLQQSLYELLSNYIQKDS